MSKSPYNTRNKTALKKVVDSSSSSDSESEEEEWSTDSSYSESESESSESEKEKEAPSSVKKKSKKPVEEHEDDEEDSEYDGGEIEQFDNKEYHKLLNQLFPSNYTKQKVEKDKSVKDKSDTKKKDTKKRTKPVVKPVKEEEKESEEEEEETEDNKINIFLTIGDDEYEAYNAYNDEADEEDELDTDDEATFMKETFEKIELPTSNIEENKKDKKRRKKKESNKEEEELLVDIEPEYKELLDLKKVLIEKYNKNPKSRILKRAIKECSMDIRKLIKKTRTKNVKEYRKMIYGDNNKMTEMEYFKKKLSNKEQITIMKDLKEINKHLNVDKPYRLSLLQSNIPPKFKACALQKLNVLRTMEPGDPEYYKIKNWVDTFMRVPFCVYKSLSVSMNDGLDKCHDFMHNAKSILDNCVYGLDDAKLQILQMVGQWISNPSAMGTAIAIKGPMGTGKTTLVKEGISKILGREFAFIALGGAGDSSYLEGHSYTYEGSTWGKIVQILIDSKCMNPVIYFDELDKISETPRGEEIIGILTHLTDTSQNSEFHDKYFSDIDFDLSKCLFIFSYNDETKVNSILKDRMYRIQTKGYDAKEKITIAQKYLLPKIREQVNFDEGQVIIPDDIIQYLVTTEAFTKKEDGVRNLKRCLEIIHTKLNLFRLIKPEDNIFAKDIGIHVEFPITVTRKHVDAFIKNEQQQNQSLLAMYI